MNKLAFLLLILLVWFQYLLWIGKNGIFDLISMCNTIKSYKNINNIAQMRERNNKLLYEIYDLANGYESVEEHARYDLGMIKFDEIFYQIELQELY